MGALELGFGNSQIQDVINETFTDDADGWSYVDGSGGGWSSGTFTVTNGSCAYIRTTGLSLTNGVTYNYSFQLTAKAANTQIWMRCPVGTVVRSLGTEDTATTYTGTFTAGSTGDLDFVINGYNAGASFTIDNIRIWQ